MRVMIFMAAAFIATGQDQLSLKAAVAEALQPNPSVKASSAQRDAAQAGIDEAKSGTPPKVNYTESRMRSDNSVVVFSSLLTQRQIAQGNFALSRSKCCRA